MTPKKTSMIKALTSSKGIVSTACQNIGISRNTHYEWLTTDSEYKQACDEAIESAIDFVENALLTRIEQGDTTATIFYLKTKGKSRGYVERQEIEHKTKDFVINFVEK